MTNAIAGPADRPHAGRLHWLVLGLLAAWPFLSFLDHNRDDAPIYWKSIVIYGVVFVGMLYALSWLGGVIFGERNRARVSNTLAVGAVCLFSYLGVAGVLSGFGLALGTIKIAIWLVGSLAIMASVWLLSGRPNTTLVLAVAALAMVATPVFRLGVFLFEGGRVAASTQSAGHVGAIAAKESPNVYWVILDEYSRADVLEAYFGYDNRPFLSELKSRGFYVADDSYSNYASTKLSISTTASMDYFLPVGAPLHPRMWTARLQGFNRVVDEFESRGYLYVHADPGGNNGKTRCGGRESLCITSGTSGVLGLDEADLGLLKLTAVFPIVRTLFPRFFSFDFTELNHVSTKIHSIHAQKPVYAFIHIMSPHPPQRYNYDCSRVKQIAFDLAGDEAVNSPQIYLNDLKCLNSEVVKFIESILSGDRSDPIIIIQGDHGYRGEPQQFAEPVIPAIDRRLIRYANLNALRLPGRCQNLLRPDLSSVNTFRIVLACLDGADIKQLPDRIYTHAGGRAAPLELNRGIQR